ncbi:hypothetical protein ACQEVF_44130 [Nonomuraea polychroma]|uniref:hypothetical protein n=1 Tax=Nonomuraea polychroma TaxID=46176 RepID=UPI003D8EBD1C
MTVARAALFTDMLVYGLAVPILPLLPSVAAAGHAAGGALFAAHPAAMVAVTPLAGRLTDRHGARTPRRPTVEWSGSLQVIQAVRGWSTAPQSWRRSVGGLPGAHGSPHSVRESRTSCRSRPASVNEYSWA